MRFTEHVIAAVLAYANQSYIDLCEHVYVLYEWKEWDKTSAEWVTWRKSITATEYSMSMLANDEEFYSKRDYRWQPQIILLTSTWEAEKWHLPAAPWQSRHKSTW